LPLLRLPAELRNEVYKYVLGGKSILVCSAKTRSHANLLIHQHFFSAPHRNDCAFVHHSRRDLSILETYRQINAEARSLPFTLNAFVSFPEALADLDLVVGGSRSRLIEEIQVLVLYSDVMTINPARRRFKSSAIRTYADMDLSRRFPALCRLEIAWKAGRGCMSFWSNLRSRLRVDLEHVYGEWIRENGVKTTVVHADGDIFV